MVVIRLQLAFKTKNFANLYDIHFLSHMSLVYIYVYVAIWLSLVRCIVRCINFGGLQISVHI